MLDSKYGQNRCVKFLKNGILLKMVILRIGSLGNPKWFFNGITAKPSFGNFIFSVGYTLN